MQCELGGNSIFYPPFIGPYEVLARLNDSNYRIKKLNAPRSQPMVVGVRRLKPYHDLIDGERLRTSGREVKRASAPFSPLARHHVPPEPDVDDGPPALVAQVGSPAPAAAGLSPALRACASPPAHPRAPAGTAIDAPLIRPPSRALRHRRGEIIYNERLAASMPQHLAALRHSLPRRASHAASAMVIDTHTPHRSSPHSRAVSEWHTHHSLGLRPWEF